MVAQPVEVSVVVPTHNAERWAAPLVAGLRQQTFPGWEAVVVDDGSTDGTIDAFLAQSGDDPRFRVLSRPHLGVSAARNAGIEAARHEWLVFLDADDRLDPTCLERLTAAATRRPELELVRCQWSWETSQGQTMVARDPELDELGEDFFLVAARRCPTAPMAVMVRRAVVDEVGRFDSSLVVGEDWDLWQRIGRRGVVAALVPEPLAYYRLTEGSAMRRDFVRICADSCTVVRRGHQPDPRVPHPRPDLAAGAPATGLPRALDTLVLWTVAAAIGVGADPAAVLDAFPPAGRPEPDDAATALFGNIPTAAGVLPHQWPDIWERIGPRIAPGAAAIAMWMGRPESASAIARGLEGRIVAHTPVPAGCRIGASQAADVDLADGDIDLPDGDGSVQTVARVSHRGVRLGTATISIPSGPPGHDAVRRAIASDVAGAVAAVAVRHPGTLPELVTSLGAANVGRALLIAAGRRASSVATEAVASRQRARRGRSAQAGLVA